MFETLGKVKYILGDQYRHVYFLIAIFLLASIAELFSIGLIGPFIALAINPQDFDQFQFWMIFKDYFKISNDRDGIVILGLIMIFFFFLKSYFSYYVYNKIVKFAYNHQKLLRISLMHVFQEMPYVKFLNKNSSTLINIVNNHVALFTNSFVAILRMFSELIVVFALFMLLLYTNFFVTLFLIILFSIILIIYNFFWKSAVELTGEQYANSSKGIINSVSQALSGLKQIRVLDKEKFFLNKLFIESNNFSDASKKHYRLQIIPRYLIECLLLAFIIGLTLLSVIFSQNPTELLVTLGIFGVAALRLLPSFLVVMAGLTSISNSKHIVLEIYDNLIFGNNGKKINFNISSSVDKNNHTYVFSENISLNNVSFRYLPTRKLAVNNISFKIEKNKSIGIIGPSGSGKTTLVDLLLGLYEPFEGDITVDNISIYKNPKAWMKNVSYISQEVFLIDASIKNNIALGINDNKIDEKKLFKAVKLAQLTQFVAELDDGLDTLIGERGARISGGQKQRIALARSFYFDRQVIIMDEATAAIDNKTEQEIVKAIDNLHGKVTLIVIAHRYSTIKSCDVLYKIVDGRLVESGTYKDIIEN